MWAMGDVVTFRRAKPSVWIEHDCVQGVHTWTVCCTVGGERRRGIPTVLGDLAVLESSNLARRIGAKLASPLIIEGEASPS